VFVARVPPTLCLTLEIRAHPVPRPWAGALGGRRGRRPHPL